MVICIGGHCWEIVEIPWPVPRGPGPGPINYPPFLYDATIVASMETAARQTHKKEVQDELLRGIDAAKKAMQRLVGPDVEIHDEYPSK
jgi:hypothetical protein